MTRSGRKKNKIRISGNIFELTCGSNPREISGIEKFLQQIGKKLNIDDGTMYRMLVSCTEAVNNAIIHGNQSNPEKKVIIRCVADKNVLTIRVRDEGKGFDPALLEDPRDEKNLLKENGRGVFLIRSLMDRVTFKKFKSGSVVEMKVKLPL